MLEELDPYYRIYSEENSDDFLGCSLQAIMLEFGGH